MTGTPINITGRRFGRVKVLHWDGWMADGKRQAWLCRCDCGTEWRSAGQPLREGGTRQCRKCHAAENRRRGRDEMSVPLPNGKTIAQIANEAGLSVNTVYRRFLRGWPVKKLGAPLRYANRTNGWGGSIDLPERRGLMLGRQA